MNDTPVSQLLEAQLHERIRDKGIVVWLDRHGLYDRFADDLERRWRADDLPYAVLCWRGSHMALVAELERLTRGRNTPRLLLHLPGFTEEDVHRSPMLAFWKAGTRFRRSLERLIREAALGKVPPADVLAFLDTDPASLEQADAWLAEQLRPGTPMPEVWAELPLTTLVEDLLAKGPLSSTRPDALWELLRRRVGLERDWLSEVVGLREDDLPDRTEQLVYALTSWAMCVEFVHDLEKERRGRLEDGRLQPLASLPEEPIVKGCREVCRWLRRNRPELYERHATSTEDLVRGEIKATDPAHLGDVDTFSLEADRIFEGACDDLAAERWTAALRQARVRLEKKSGRASFWLQRQPLREHSWKLVAALAQLGRSLAQAGRSLPRGRSVDEAAEAYARKGWPADRAHRELEQLVDALLPTLQDLPGSSRLRSLLAELRGSWESWASNWSRDFAQRCELHGFLPESDLQQRMIFDQVVGPWANGSRPVALFLVDALRYEMGEVLREVFEAEATATTVRLAPRLAELPSDTSVGMNVLAPVVRAGRLEAVVDSRGVTGFRAGGAAVCGTKARRKAFRMRSGSERCPSFSVEEVLASEPAKLAERMQRAALVLVSCDDIDRAGEHGAGPQAFPSAMQRIAAAWRRLRDAGIRRYVITADHGFLMLHEPERLPHGRRNDPRRRYILRAERLREPHLQSVALSELEYTGSDSHHVLHMPRGIQVFDRGERPDRMVHGGNSLQERMIPVLTVEHRVAPGRAGESYRIVARRGEDFGEMVCISGTLEPDRSLSLGFGGPRDIGLELQVPERPEVRVQLVSVRHGGRLQAERIRVRVGEPFEIFFKLLGDSTRAARVRLAHPWAEADVEAFTLDEPFDVLALLGRRRAPEVSEVLIAAEAEIPAYGSRTEVPDALRPAFEHLLRYGNVSEQDLFQLVGPAKARRFARKVALLAEAAGFSIRIEVVNGLKCYVREP